VVHIPVANLRVRLGQREEVLISISLILATFWAARHMLHGSFGFYEDDYTLVVRAMAADWPEVREFLFRQFSQFAGQGRPLQHGMVFLFGYLSGRLGGLLPAYWLAYVIVATNCVLFYFLLRKLGDGSFALVGGLAYSLFSADTTQAFLYHAFGLQPALTFLILASLAYLSERRVLAYVLSLGSLLSYETTYMVFLGVPLLEREWNRSWSKRLALHAAIGLAILGVVTAIRATIGEERVLGLSAADLFKVSFLHTLQGPPVALGSYFLRPTQAVLDIDLGIGLASLISFGVFWAAISRMSILHRPDAGERTRLIRLLLAGLGLVALAYPLTFTIRAYAISGRDTRVHLAAVAGAAIVFASAGRLALSISAQGRLRRVVPAGLAAILGLLVGFGLVVQKDYARAWELQRRFWSTLVPFVPDMGVGTVIIVDPAGLIDTQHIDANTWNLPLILQYIYEFPSGWDPKPSVHRLLPDWRARSLHNQLEIKAVDFKWEYIVVPWDKAILVETLNGWVMQRVSEVEFQGDNFRLDSEPLLGEEPFHPGALYEEFLSSGFED
jgi:hypothetical protein